MAESESELLDTSSSWGASGYFPYKSDDKQVSNSIRGSQMMDHAPVNNVFSATYNCTQIGRRATTRGPQSHEAGAACRRRLPLVDPGGDAGRSKIGSKGAREGMIGSTQDLITGPTKKYGFL